MRKLVDSMQLFHKTKIIKQQGTFDFDSVNLNRNKLKYVLDKYFFYFINICGLLFLV